ncbi:MAG: asparagine synthase (glutamine-hydrolyzing) [Ginsengibacter sp.]
MCGITGIAYFNKERNINPEVLNNMSKSIYHRGPDDEGYYIKGNIGLGFRRLSIIDLETGHQPMSNQNNTIHIVFNGEIYNYQELKKNLIQKGYLFRTSTDTEVILHLYEHYGENCLQYLRGMFAFTIWNATKQQMFCARDRFGIKPFYYSLDNEKFVFGSEIKSILKSDNVEKSLSYEALDSYFAFGYITSDLSIYKNIKKLQPAHYLLISFRDDVHIEIKRYWYIDFNPDFSKNEKYWAEQIEESFSESIKIHMISDVPLGAFLSGGIDSSAVVAMMSRHTSHPIKTFSIGFNEKKYSELPYAREMAKKYGCDHHELIVEPESIGLLPKLVSAYDEPFADSSAIPTYYVSKLAKQHVKVALSGDGGDELFAGYNSYSVFKKIHNNPLSSSSNFLQKSVWGNVHSLFPSNLKGKGLTRYLSKDKRYQFAYMSWPKEERKKLFQSNSPAVDYSIASEIYKENILKNSSSNDYVTNMQYLDLQTYMVDDVLTKVDRASMLNSLEVRVPFLDHKFAELSFKIPSEFKLKGLEQKYILKKSMAPFLSESILSQPKKGFSTPISIWFKDDLKEYISDTFNSPNCLLYDILDPKYIKEKILKNNSKNNDHTGRIWSLLFLNEWLQQNKLNT